MKSLIEYNLHGKAYYAVYSFPCPCKYRQHDCKGNELSDEEIAEAVRLGPAREDFIHSDDTLEALEVQGIPDRLNPGKDLFGNMRWKDDGP